MTDAFVSYSRRDSQFVARLAESIQERGKSVWLDTEGLADGEVFPQALRSAIEESDAFLFVITPESATSAYCEQEVEHAWSRGKRILPLLRTAVPDDELHEQVRDRNWIPFDDDDQFDASMDRLIKAMDTDVEHSKEHTRWLLKALEWDSEGRDGSVLLRGSELAAAEGWLARTAETADPAPTPIQREYLLASRLAASRRQRRLVGASLLVATVSIGLLIFALISRAQVIDQKTAARAQALAAESQAQLVADPPASVLLAARAVRTRATPQTLLALTQALDVSPLLVGLPRQRSALTAPICHGPGVAYSPDGARIAYSACDGQLVVADAYTGRAIRQASVGRRAGGVAYSPDGTMLAVETDTHLQLRTADTLAWRETLPGPGMGESPGGAVPLTGFVAFSPDGTLLAAVTAHTVTLWDLRKGTFRTLGQPSPFGFGTLAFTPDGRRLIVGGSLGGSQGASYVYRLPQGTLERRLVTPTAAPGLSDIVATAPDNRHVAVAYVPAGSTVAGIVRLFDLRTGQAGPTIAQDAVSEIFALAISPDGRRLAIGTFGGGGVWSIASHLQLAAYEGNTLPITGLAFSPDGERVVSSDDNGITRVWRAHGAERADIEGVPVAAISRWSSALLPDRLVTAGTLGTQSVVGFWHLPDGARPEPLVVGPSIGAQGIPVTTGISDDGRFAAVLAVGARGPHITIWSLADRRVVRTLPAPPAFAIRWSRDDKRLILIVAVIAAAGQPIQGNLAVLDAVTGRPTKPDGAALPCGDWQDVSPSPDGRLLAASTGCGAVWVWDLRSGRRLRVFDTGGFAGSISFAPDSVRLLVVGPETAVWNVRTGRRLTTLVGHTGPVTAGAFSADGVHVATASFDRTIRLWDARTGRVVRIYGVPSPPLGLRFSADGQSVAMLDQSNTVRVFDACGACSAPAALLKLAQQRLTGPLTPRDRSALAGS